MAGRVTGPIPAITEQLLAPSAAADAGVSLAQAFLRRFGYLREGASIGEWPNFPARSTRCTDG